MLYESLELGPKCPVKCPDHYTDESTRICPRSRRLFLQIVGEARAIVQLGVMPQGVGTGKGSIVWQPEEPYVPMVASLARRFDAVRVRNWKAGEEAEVLINIA